MPHRRQPLITNEIYHVVVRGVADSLVFKDINDYYRAVFSIYEFNTAKPVIIRERREKIVRDPVSDPLVKILAFCFMPNHIHLLLRQLEDGGISKFMNKFGAGYPAYFREKYRLRGQGYFFQGRFVAVHIETEAQLIVITVYIHINPTSLVEPNWKEEKIRDPDKIIKFLESYKWSSYPDYIGKKNFPLVTKRNLLLEIMDGEEGHKKAVEDWVRHKGQIKEFADIALE